MGDDKSLCFISYYQHRLLKGLYFTQNGCKVNGEDWGCQAANDKNYEP